ncbi:MAG: hypothetical protein QM820_26670 [Minicystis sp.]
MKATRPSAPWSRICTTCGLLIDAAARASCSKRPRISAASSRLAVSTSFTAIEVPSVTWSARHTSPIAPAPMGAWRR